uniref:DUF4806 domain-containing protein n=1 Tax=Anopheles minimus TaxID=112268 RepID=A0A182WK98_9DIPT
MEQNFQNKFCAEMLPSKRNNKSNNVLNLRRKLEIQNSRDLDAAQEQTTIKVEYVSDDEQDYEIFATTDESFLATLKMTCSDSEDPFGDAAAGGSVSQASHTEEHPGKKAKLSAVGSPNGSPLNANAFMNMFRSLSKQITTMHNKIDRMRIEVRHNTERLERVEKKVSLSMRTLDRVKDVIIMIDESAGNHLNQEMQSSSSPAPSFEFNKITNEEEFTAFDTKLGKDEEYYFNMKQGFRLKILADEPDNRMHEAIDMIFERAFMPLCSWTGHGAAGPKIPFGTRKNILKLFADIGTNNYMTVNELFVENFFKNKLRHAKQRLHLKGIVKTACRKRRTDYNEPYRRKNRTK